MLEKTMFWLLFLGAAGWILGTVIQFLVYGYVSEPCCN